MQLKILPNFFNFFKNEIGPQKRDLWRENRDHNFYRALHIGTTYKGCFTVVNSMVGQVEMSCVVSSVIVKCLAAFPIKGGGDRVLRIHHLISISLSLISV